MPDAPGPLTPIYLKTQPGEAFPAPSDPVYYVVAGNGLFIGRNATVGPARFRSIVPAATPPAELLEQPSRLLLDYPRLPAADLARVVGFFYRVARRHGAEAMVMLALDEASGAIDLIVPRQTAGVSHSGRGEVYPIDLRYEWTPPPGAMPPRIVGDIHSHGFEAAYASALDQRDEVHAPGLHVVMGRLYRDPPEIHVEFVVDGTRFAVQPEDVLDLENYTARNEDTPQEWLERVQVRSYGRASPAGRTWSAPYDAGRFGERDGRERDGREEERRWS